uniref:Uncharacterized protein n=1 Tax=Steinernema glaseri TaxID=37863 RepID=A0A1I7Z3K0_9BILA
MSMTTGVDGYFHENEQDEAREPKQVDIGTTITMNRPKLNSSKSCMHSSKVDKNEQANLSKHITPAGHAKGEKAHKSSESNSAENSMRKFQLPELLPVFVLDFRRTNNEFHLRLSVVLLQGQHKDLPFKGLSLICDPSLLVIRIPLDVRSQKDRYIG